METMLATLQTARLAAVIWLAVLPRAAFALDVKQGEKRVSSVADMIEAVRGPNMALALAARQELVRLGEPAARPLCELLDPRQPHGAASMAADALVEIGGPAVPALTHMLADSSRCGGAAEVLGRIGAPAAAAAGRLEALAGGGGDLECRGASARALGGIGPGASAAAGTLGKLLANPDYRCQAAEGLAGIGARVDEAVAALGRCLTTSVAHQEMLRVWAGRALGRLGGRHARAIPLLAEAFRKEESSYVRASHAESLGELGSEARLALPDLVRRVGRVGEVLYDSNSQETERDAVLTALRAVGPASTEQVPELVRLLGDESEKTAEQAAIELGRLPSLSGDALSALVGGLSSARAGVRDRCAQALGNPKVRRPEVLRALERALLDGSEVVRESARRSLAALGEDADGIALRLADRLAAASGDERLRAAENLAHMGRYADRAVPVLVKALDDRDEFTAVRAARALGAIGAAARDAVPALAAAAGRRGLLRAAVRDSLGRIGTPEALRALEKDRRP